MPNAQDVINRLKAIRFDDKAVAPDYTQAINEAVANNTSAYLNAASQNKDVSYARQQYDLLPYDKTPLIDARYNEAMTFLGQRKTGPVLNQNVTDTRVPFKQVIDSLSPGDRVKLPDGTIVTKAKETSTAPVDVKADRYMQAVREQNVQGVDAAKLTRDNTDVMNLTDPAIRQLVGGEYKSRWQTAFNNAKSESERIALHRMFLATDPDYKAMYNATQAQTRQEQYLANQKKLVESEKLNKDNLSYITDAIPTISSFVSGAVSGASSELFNSPLLNTDYAKQLGLQRPNESGMTFGEILRANESQSPIAAEAGRFLGQLAQMLTASQIAQGIAAPVSELASLSPMQGRMLASAATFGGMSLGQSALNLEDAKTAFLKMGAQAGGAAIGKYLQEAVISALGVAKMIPGTTKWRIASLLGDSTFDLAQTMTDPFQMKQYMDNPVMFLRDFAMNVLFQQLDLYKQRNPDKITDIDFLKEQMQKDHDSFKSDPNTRAKLEETISKVSEIIDDPHIIETAEVVSEMGGIESGKEEVQAPQEVKAEAPREAVTDYVAEKVPVEDSSMGTIRNDTVGIDSMTSDTPIASAYEGVTKSGANVKSRNLSEQQIASSPAKSQEDIDAIDDYIDTYGKMTGDSIEVELDRLARLALLKAEGDMLGGLVDPMPNKPVDLQIFALKTLAEKMKADNVTAVLEHVFGKNLENLTPEKIAVLEHRDDSEDYTPLIVTYDKMKNADVWAKAQAKLSTEDGRRDILMKYDEDGIQSAEDVAALIKLGMDYLRSGTDEEIVMGSEILARLGNRASRMGQANAILAKAYIEMGIMNRVKDTMHDAAPGMVRRGKKSGIAEVKDKVKETTNALLNEFWKDYEGNDKAQDTRVTPAERLAETIDNIAKSKYKQGPEEAKPLVDLASELVRLVRQNNPELGKKLKQGASALDNLSFLVKNRAEYGKMLDDAFEMIESAYRADPAKYPRPFIEEMHKYLNDVAEIRTQRFDAAIKQVLKDTGLTFKELITDWMTKGEPKMQSFLDYIKDNTTLNEADAKYMVDALQARLDVLKEEKRSSILKNMFKDVSPKTKRTFEDKFMEAVGLGVITDAKYGPIWAEKMGIPYFTPEMASDISKTMKQYFDIDPDAVYPTGKKQEGAVATQLHKTFGSKYDGASEAPGWYVRQQLYDGLIERMSAHVPMEAWGKVESFLYSAMLSGFNSWIKNPAANLILMGVSRNADVMNAFIQRGFVKPENRTVTPGGILWRSDSELVKTVEDVYERRALPSIKAEGLEAGIERMLKRNQRVFKSDFLNEINKLPFKAMEMGDLPYLRSHFEDALGKYMKAQKTTEVTDAAYQFAYDRALEDTFRDLTSLNFALNTIKKLDKWMPEIRKLNNQIENAKTDAEAKELQKRLDRLLLGADVLKVAKQAVLPFVNTTTNVAMRMLDYSPYALVTNAVKHIWKASKGTFNGAELSRDISKMIAGTMYGSIAGMVLAQIGEATGAFSINGGYPQDESEKKRWQVEGRMPYTIGVKMKDGRTEYITFDWASPAVAPFFMGAMFQQNVKKDGITLKSLGDAGVAGMDVLWQMSFVQGLNSMLGGYGTPTTKIAEVAAKLPFQGFPQWLAKVNYVIDDTVRQYPNDKDIVQASINNLLRRLPGGSLSLQPKLDAWGNEIKQGQLNPKLGAFGRFLNAYLAPYRVYNGNTAAETQEVVRIYRAARDAGETSASTILPDFSSLSLPAEDTKLSALTAEEITEMNRIAGKYAREQLAKEMASADWASLPDYSPNGGSKFDAIKRIYEDARAKAVGEIQTKRGVAKPRTITPSKLTVGNKDYIISESKYQQYTALANKYKAEGFTNPESAAKSEILRSMGYSVPLVKPVKAYSQTKPKTTIDTTGG